MSNEEIIEVLEDLWKYEHSKYSEKEIREAIEKGIEALENQKSIIEELEEIRKWLIDNIMRNPFIMFDDHVRYASSVESFDQDTIDLIAVIAFLYEKLHKQVTNDSYEYMFHWANKIGSWVETYDTIDKCKEGDEE